MIYPRLHRSFLLLIGILLTVSAQAQDDDYQQKLTDLKLEQQQLRTELQTTSAALQRLQQQAEAKREKYLKAQREVIAATARHNENPSEHNQAKINNAEFKLALAEHKLKKFNSKLGDLKLKQQQTQQQLLATELASADAVKEQARRLWLQKVASAEATASESANIEAVVAEQVVAEPVMIELETSAPAEPVENQP